MTNSKDDDLYDISSALLSDGQIVPMFLRASLRFRLLNALKSLLMNFQRTFPVSSALLSDGQIVPMFLRASLRFRLLNALKSLLMNFQRTFPVLFIQTFTNMHGCMDGWILTLSNRESGKSSSWFLDESHMLPAPYSTDPSARNRSFCRSRSLATSSIPPPLTISTSHQPLLLVIATIYPKNIVNHYCESKNLSDIFVF